MRPKDENVNSYEELCELQQRTKPKTKTRLKISKSKITKKT